MSNKIDSMTNQYLQITGRPAAQTPSTDANSTRAAKPESGQAARGDTVELTDSARQLQALESKLAGVSEVDQSRVDQVRSRIEAGEYQVSSERVADKMIALDRALPSDE